METKSCTKILIFSAKFSCENLAVEDFVTLLQGKNLVDGEMFFLAWFRQTCVCSSMRGRYKIQIAEGWICSYK